MTIELVIKWDQATGQIHVTGPITDRAVSYMLLEMAKDLVRDQAVKSASGNIVAVPAGLRVT